MTYSFQPQYGRGVDLNSTRIEYQDLPGGKTLPERKADNIFAICEPTVYNMWEP
jgi:hypothetical protein